MSISNICRECAFAARFVPLVAFTAVFFAQRSTALDPNRPIARYIHDRWRTDQAFPGGAVNAFAATPDGYLWIGADKGLVRFDGISFRLYSHTDLSSITSRVLGLTVDREGSLWVRPQTPDLVRFEKGAFRQVFQNATPEDGVTAMGAGLGGDVLLARPGRVYRYSKGKLLEIAPAMGGHGRTATSLAETSDGTVWIGTRDEGLLSLQGGKVSVTNGLADRKINCVLSTGTELWIGSDHGLEHGNAAGISSTGIPEPLRRAEVLALIRDRDANIWAGTSDGLFRIDSKGVATLYRPEGRRRGPVNALFEDREGNLWAGSSSGIERYRDLVFLTYPFNTDEQSQDAGPIFADSGGRTWYGLPGGGLSWLSDNGHGNIVTDGLDQDVIYSITGGPGELWAGRQRNGLTQLREQDGSFVARTYTSKDGLASGGIYVVHRARDGAVWAGTLNGGLSRLRNGRITTYTTASGLLSNSISAIEDDSNGTVWVATSNGLQSFANEQWKAYSSRDGMPPGRVNCLAHDSNGVLWIGTDVGLAFIRSGRPEIPQTMPDSLREPILGIADDKRGNLWVATSGHVVRASRAGLLEDRKGPANVREFVPADGLASNEGIRRSRSVVPDHLGRIWFSLQGGISVVDPARVVTGSPPAIVHILAVTAGGRPLDPSAALRIQAAQERIEFRYIGLSLSIPERVRYRYRLDSYDRDWTEPSAVQEAVYTNLAPGSYRFRVIASNSEGAWNSSEAIVRMDIVPPLWQTWWFRAAFAAICALSVILMYRLHLRRLAATLNLTFEERLAERNRIARELHDTLLQGFLSASMHVHVAAEAAPEDSKLKPVLTRALELMRQVIEEGRNAVRGLRTFDEASLDLEHAFLKVQEETMLQMRDAGPVDFRVIVEGERRPLHPFLRDEIYRIGREALINAFRHARAKRIELELKYSSNRLRVLVRDDGCGIDPEILRQGRDGHWGLPGMRERANRIGARLHFMSRSSGGTQVELSVPGSLAFKNQTGRRLPWFGRQLRQDPRSEPSDPNEGRE